ncbi:MAG TPA: phosphoribosylanthranilate isomerase [Ktedonobacterales bacterium]|nr:phosphoribosylanthranilate isomerase [Ktedonobacterales bacterium]
MRPIQTPRVKVCCISAPAEAALAIAAGVAAVGLVSAMPSGPGVIAEDLIASIAARVPPGVASFLLTSLQDPDAIIAQQRRCGATTLQLVDRLDRSAYPRLRAALPGIGLVQVIHVTGAESLAEAVAVAPLVDALLLDSGNQALPIKELGGTGRVHDWRVSRAIREAVEQPLYLAGGLTPENVAEAIATVAPFGLDVCGGVRVQGKLDADRLARFMAAVRAA